MGKVIMTFFTLIEIGKIVFINYGIEYGKILCIVDIIDHNRVLVDAPGEIRRLKFLKQLALTKLKIDIPRAARKKTLQKKLTQQNILSKFASRSWALNIAKRKAKSSLTDFECFKKQSEIKYITPELS